MCTKRVCTFAYLLFASSIFGTAPVLANVDLRSPTGLLGTTQSYTSDGITVTAYGFDCFVTCAVGTTYSATNLWGDSITGLGIESDPNHQISPTNFVMFDWQVFFDPDPTKAIRFIPSVVPFSDRIGTKIFLSNTLGDLEHGLIVSDTPVELTQRDFRYVALSGYHIDIRMPDSFTLSTIIVSSIPEPEIYMMLLVGSVMVGLTARRRKLKHYSRSA